jgi:phosphoribosylformylglycinamidine synthase
VGNYKSNNDATEWVIDMIITDNEAASVQNTLKQLGFDVEITRQTHWEIGTNGNSETVLKKIDDSGELYNSNKEFISQIAQEENCATLLVRQKEDIRGRSKFESLTERFEIDGITSLKRGVIWNLKFKGGNLDTVLKDILTTHILFNPLSHECYKIN